MINIPAKLKKVDEMKTETKLVFSTKEPLDLLVIEQLTDSIGYLVFNRDELSETALKIAKNRKFGMNDDGFTPSQKLRLAIFNYHNEIESNEPFESYYQRAIKRSPT